MKDDVKEEKMKENTREETRKRKLLKPKTAKCELLDRKGRVGKKTMKRTMKEGKKEGFEAEKT